MVDTCTCCNGCSSRQLPSYSRNSFPKKLLVAISVVVIVAMCLMPAEARSLEHKKRHQRPDNTAHPTKDSTMKSAAMHRRRHQSQRRQESMTQLLKARKPKNAQTDPYHTVTKDTVKKLHNTRTFLAQDRKKLGLDDLKEYKNTIPSWLPTVSFVEIHYHDYRRSRSRKNGSTIPERKFMYIMPKLYKGLVEYEQIFKRLLHVEQNFPDDPHQTYKRKRTQAIQNTLDNLFSTIEEVKHNMGAFNLTVTPFNKNKLDLSSLETKVDWTQCIKNDYLAFRGYFNLLKNWLMEFRCPKGKQLNKTMCQKYEEKLHKKQEEQLKHRMNRRTNIRSR